MTHPITVRYSLATDTLFNASYNICCYAIVGGYLFVHQCGGQLSARQMLRLDNPVEWLDKETQKAVDATHRLLNVQGVTDRFLSDSNEYDRAQHDDLESAIPHRLTALNNISTPAGFIEFLRGGK